VDLPLRCPVCNFPFAEVRDSGFIPPVRCPYENTSHPELCSLHDKIYFGKWRKMDADPIDILRAYRKIVHLLSAVGRVAAGEKNPQARLHLKKAGDVLTRAFPEGDPFGAVKFMDQALSYAHHAINDLINHRAGRPHDPAAYEVHYDVILPFKEDL
jgi:hypothetical protein